MLFEQEASELNPPSHAAPIPVLSLGYEAIDADRAHEQLRYRAGLLLMAIALISLGVIDPIMTEVSRSLSRIHYVQAYCLLEFLSDLSMAAGAWVVLGFVHTIRQQSTTFGAIGRLLLALAFTTQSLKLIYQVLLLNGFSGLAGFALAELSELFWIGISVGVVVYVAHCVKALVARGLHRVLIAAAFTRGALGFASCIYAYVFFSSLMRGRRPASWMKVSYWQHLEVALLAALLANGIILLLIVRSLRRSEIAPR